MILGAPGSSPAPEATLEPGAPSHVDDPLAVVKEAARVEKPGGMVGLFDGDYA